MAKRRTFSPEFKSRLVLVLSIIETIKQTSAKWRMFDV